MNVFIVGIAGRTGGELARLLVERGDVVRGLVRGQDQAARLAASGIGTVVGDVAELGVEEVAAALGDSEAIIFAAGSNGGSVEVTRAVDDLGVRKTIDAARLAGTPRLVLLSVFPESWRERHLSDEEEYYFAAKKRADNAVTRSGLDWVILRPSLLTDDPGAGLVSLGPAELHGQIARADVAAVLAALLHEPRISRQILELNTGPTPVIEAVRASVRG